MTISDGKSRQFPIPKSRLDTDANEEDGEGDDDTVIEFKARRETPLLARPEEKPRVRVSPSNKKAKQRKTNEDAVIAVNVIRIAMGIA